MIRALLRLLSMIALSVAVIMCVLDATRSIAADQLVMTPLGESWMAVAPASLLGLEAFVLDRMPAFAWDPMMLRVLSLPGFAVMAGLAFILHMLGYPRRRRGEMFAALRRG